MTQDPQITAPSHRKLIERLWGLGDLQLMGLALAVLLVLAAAGYGVFHPLLAAHDARVAAAYALPATVVSANGDLLVVDYPTLDAARTHLGYSYAADPPYRETVRSAFGFLGRGDKVVVRDGAVFSVERMPQP